MSVGPTQNSFEFQRDLNGLLFKYAERNEPQSVRSLLSIKASSNCTGDDFSTPLHIAAGKGHSQVMKLLLESGAEKYNCDSFRETAMDRAITCEYPKAVEVLVEAGYDVNHLVHGRRPLDQACGKASVEIVSYLLFKKADVALSPHAIFLATRDPRCLKPMLEHKASVNVRKIKSDSIGSEYQPLHYAALLSPYESVRMLLEAGADPASVESNGRTAQQIMLYQFLQGREPGSFQSEQEAETYEKIVELFSAEVEGKKEGK